MGKFCSSSVRFDTPEVGETNRSRRGEGGGECESEAAGRHRGGEARGSLTSPADGKPLGKE